METPPGTNLTQRNTSTLRLGDTPKQEREGKLKHARPLRVSLTCVQLSATLVHLTSPLQRPMLDGSTARVSVRIIFVNDG